MDAFVILATIAAVTILAASAKKNNMSGVDDPEVTLANIRMGVSRDWYKAQLTTIGGKKYVKLSGNRTDGGYTSDVYPVSDETYAALLSDGIEEV